MKYLTSRSAAALPLLLIMGCTTMPTGPRVMVLPGDGKDFRQFTYDDAACRDWAARTIGMAPAEAAAADTVTGAAVGTALGAASGAAIGAAAGDPGAGAAVGAGVGLLTGTAVGADRGMESEYSLQQRYDAAYMQCMYAAGHQVPVPGGLRRRPPPPPGRVPPPPPGAPPPPPPGIR